MTFLGGLYHIGHRPYCPQPHRARPHRPHEKTISAKRNNHIGHKKMYCYLASSFISCQSETRNVVCMQSRLTSAESTQQLSTYWCEYIIARIVGVWATIHCQCSSPAVGLEQERELSSVGRLTDSCSAASLSYLLTRFNSSFEYCILAWRV